MQKKITQKLHSNIIKSLGLIVVLFTAGIIYITYIEQTRSLHNFKKVTGDYIDKSIHHTIEATIERYTTISTRMIDMYDLRKFILQNDREGFIKALDKRFEDIKKENPYFETMHFIHKDGTSFVRMHQKEKYGDNIASFRPMVREILKTKQIQIGHETGHYATVFRILIPVFDQENFLGSFGIGIDPNYFMDKISTIIEHKGALFIKTNKLELFKEHPSYNISLGDYKLQTNIDTKTLAILQSLPKNYSFEDKFILQYENKNYLVHTSGVQDFQKNINGYFLFFHDMTDQIKQLKTTQFIIIATLVIFIILTFFIIRLFFIRYGEEINLIYTNIINQLKLKENYLKAVEDNSSSIIITTYKEKIYSANQTFFDFLEIKTIEEFIEKYGRICNLFLPKHGYLHKKMNHQFWIDYVVDNPQLTHKVIIKQNNKEHIFKVTASKIQIDEKSRYVTTLVDISDIEEIRNRLSYAISGSKDGLWDWNILTNEIYFSPRWKEMLGYSADELPDKLETWGSRVHPDDLEQALADIKANQEKKTETYKNYHRLRHRDGHWVWILDRGQTMFDEEGKAIRMIGFHTDVTLQKEEEELLVIQAQRAEALLHLPSLAEKLDEKEFMQKGQEIAENLTQSTIAFIHFVHEDQETIELVTWSNRTLKHYCHVESHESHYPIQKAGIWANALREKKPFIVNNYPQYAQKSGMPEGHAHLERFISVPVIENGKVVMLTGVGNKRDDYTTMDVETVQLVSNLIWQSVQRRRDLQQLFEKDKIMLAQSRNAAMGEMISMIAHQWRQPLAVISMGANNILADIELEMLDTNELKEACDEIIEQTKELSKTIDDFKNFFKPQKKSEMIYISEVVDKTLNVVSKSLENNNVHLEKEVITSKQVETYSRELMQVLINIINNAKEVLVEKKATDRLIRIEAIEESDDLSIKIIDNGGGIPAEIIDKIFEPYFSTKSEKTGTGLGLYMSKIIVEKHLQGEIKAYNMKNHAVFEITLPYQLQKKENNHD